MAQRKFDRNLGDVHSRIPPEPGVYRFYDESGALIYVGKAKNLKRRLSQYRNAKRRRAHAKMRKIVSEARSLEYETCASELDALILENQWIQTHRPKWNVAGAFYFLYPMIGIRIEDERLYLCYTTEPERYPDFRFHGAFRSRERTRDAFFSLVELLRSIAHEIPRAQVYSRFSLQPVKYSYCYGLRKIPTDWAASLDRFLDGSDFAPLGQLALLLLEKPDATRRAAEVQEHLRILRRFWRQEISPLKKARDLTTTTIYPIPQKERDLLWIRFHGSRNAQMTVQHHRCTDGDQGNEVPVPAEAAK